MLSYIILGVYIPDCDDEGYYRPTQCHTSVGMCWCVDKHGVEMANSRTRGKPNCGKFCGQYKIVSHVSDLDTWFRLVTKFIEHLMLNYK
jgi:hypothetical protein